jgi:hypothetical protein
MVKKINLAIHCPKCAKTVAFRPTTISHYFDEGDYGEDDAFRFHIGRCDICKTALVVLEQHRDYIVNIKGIEEIEDETYFEVVYPIKFGRKPINLPVEYEKDYIEASTVLKLSPKASAALSRRLLQNFLHDLDIKEKDLFTEISTFLNSYDLPIFIAETLQAVRMVGNFGAHPLRNKNTGRIFDVQPHEAELLLDSLENLFEFWFKGEETKRIEEMRKKVAKIKVKDELTEKSWRNSGKLPKNQVKLKPL